MPRRPPPSPKAPASTPPTAPGKRAFPPPAGSAAKANSAQRWQRTKRHGWDSR